MKVQYFRSPAELREWFRVHHDTATELWVGYYKRATGKPSVTWPESVDEALCVGWIDGIRKRIDEDRYANRFSPRRRGSTWSVVNIRRAQALMREGRMQPAGVAAFEARRENRSGIYSYEQRRDQLEEPYQGMLRKNRKAWAFFQSQPPFYRKTIGWWIVSAKREETRLKRLRALIEQCAAGRRIEWMTPAASKASGRTAKSRT